MLGAPETTHREGGAGSSEVSPRTILWAQNLSFTKCREDTSSSGLVTAVKLDNLVKFVLGPIFGEEGAEIYTPWLRYQDPM